jgi:hypothetical protein
MPHIDLTNIFIVLIVTCAIGLFLVLGNFFMIRSIRETKNRENAVLTWPNVTGKIGISEKRVHLDDDHTPVDFPHVSYIYEVDGKTYRSSNILPGGEIGGVNVESTLARYPKGADVTVYYDPHNPKDAVLEPGKNTGSNLLWLMIVLMNLMICGVGGDIVYSTLW